MAFSADSASFRRGDRGVDVVELHRDEWVYLEKMRLDALTEAPHAFVTTADDVVGRLPGYWEGQFDRATWVTAWDAGQTVGIAALAQPDSDSPTGCRFIESVWVEPAHRGCGVLRRMLHDLERRALADGADELRLWVLDTNELAERAYERLGFVPVVDRCQFTTKVRLDGFVMERLMSKRLG